MTTPPSSRLVAGHPVPTTHLCAAPTDSVRLSLPISCHHHPLRLPGTRPLWAPRRPRPPPVPPRRYTARSDYPLRHNTYHPTSDTPCPSAPTAPRRANARIITPPRLLNPAQSNPGRLPNPRAFPHETTRLPVTSTTQHNPTGLVAPSPSPPASSPSTPTAHALLQHLPVSHRQLFPSQLRNATARPRLVNPAPAHATLTTRTYDSPPDAMRRADSLPPLFDPTTLPETPQPRYPTDIP
jgi:hypothetical protein